MNCQLCQREMDAYREDRLSPDARARVETHLDVCLECSGSYNLQILADRVITREKELQPNPFLSTRIMARIEGLESADQQTVPVSGGILRPAWMITSVAAAILMGILIGNIYKPVTAGTTIPEDLALIDDAAIELVDILSNE